VMQVDIERAVRNYQLALALGQLELVRDLAGQARSEDEGANNFIWNLMVLQHEAARLGVEPGTQAVVDKIKTLPVFQTDGQFDPVKYSTFLQEQLAPRGFTERQLESVIRDSLRLEGIKALVGSPAVILPGEVASAMSRLRPFDLEVLRWNAASVAKDVEVTDEELQQAFNGQAKDLTVPEKRSVRYVLFALTPEEQKLEDKQRVAALQKVATATGEFARSLTDGGGDMAAAAGKAGLTAGTTPLFAADGSSGGALADGDGQIVPAAAKVAFRLPPGSAYEIVQVGDEGYAVIEVVAVEASRPMTFEEARADLRADLIARKRDNMVREAATAALDKVRVALAGGKPFAEAVKQAGLKAEKVSGLSLFDPEMDPAKRQLVAAAMELPDGTVSGFTPSPDGGFAVYVAGRGELAGEAETKQRPTIEAGLLEGKQMLLFAQWLATARNESNLQVLRPMM